MKLGFLEKKKEGHGIWSFYFEPIDQITWTAGQSIRLELPRETWGVDERRFTIASAPSEGYVQITTRMSESSFKQNLAKLKKGDEIKGYNIEGDFIWGKENKPRLFIAGGIGITPFRAMLAQVFAEGKQFNTTLIYGSKDTPPLFQTELHAWQAADPSFFILYRPDARLPLETQASLAPFWLENIVYVSGPEQMVKDTCRTLIKEGIPKNHLKTDLFTGY